MYYCIRFGSRFSKNMLLFQILVSAQAFLLAVEGKLAQHTLDLTWDVAAPDENPRNMVLTNGAFPGPQLFFDENDDVEVGHLIQCIHGLLKQI